METVRYAGFWRRLAASLIDTLLLFVVLAPLLFLVAHGAGPAIAEGEAGGAAVAWRDLLLQDLLPMAIVVFFWVRFGATPGKQLMDCRVVTARGHEKPSVPRALVRYLGYFLSMLPLFLGFLWVAWDRRKQGFHDKIAGTVVVMNDEAPEAGDARKTLQQLVKEAS